MKNNLETRKKLAMFLRSIADELESNHPPEKNLIKHTGEFFMSYQFLKQANIDNNDIEQKSITINREEFTYFLILCLHCYLCISTGKDPINVDTPLEEIVIIP
jgi:hypothetical protein